MSHATSTTPLDRFRLEAQRLGNILRYHRPEQLLRRFWKRSAEALGVGARPLAPGEIDVPAVRRQGRQRLHAAQTTLTVRVGEGLETYLDNLALGNLVVLDREVPLGSPIDWNVGCWPEAPLLWAFNLQYHEFLGAFLEADLPPARAALAWQIVESWLNAYPGNEPTRYAVAFHPYCISRRLPVWMRLYRVDPPPRPLGHRVLQSLAEQTDWLARHLERDICGNHLWENAKALITAGCFFEGTTADRWRQLGSSLLDRSIKEQLSPAGEHFERSPMYQADLARGLLDVANWLRPIDAVAAARYKGTARCMISFLDDIRHPDGGIPLFGDATLNFDHPETFSKLRRSENNHDSSAATGELSWSDFESSSVPTAVSTNTVAARPRADGGAWTGDYYVRSAGAHRLIFDAGNVGPDHLPAHAHADLLGFELSLHGRRAIVDSGVFCYSGPRRAEFRQTQAHNVLQIDNIGLADVWGDFRMGRRGHVIQRASGTTAAGDWVRASHDAYRHLGVTIERLWFFANDNGPWFSVHLALGADSGNSTRRLCERLHWGPDVAPVVDNRAALLPGDTGVCRWEIADGVSALATSTYAYAPRFYQEQSATLFELNQTATLPAVSAWAISFADQPSTPSARIEDGELVLTWTHDSRRRRVKLPVVSGQ